MRAFMLSIALCLWLTGCVATPDPLPAAAPRGDYTLDKNHASLILRLSHGGGLSLFTARFDDFDATLDFNPDSPEQSHLSVVIETASINTGMADFDRKLAATKNLLDASAHPQIRFVSTTITRTGPQNGEVTGILTLRGVSQPITLNVHFNGTAHDPLRGAQVIGFSADGHFSRQAFGANAWSAFGVGDEIMVHIEAEFLKT
ncbi:MAG: YceI family protein [Robiginitomaculum sp.]|nr:YceI family protein [Robiginitomaculum sp.]MDQ7078981.1 YceI family protein [Robiginitomaculum sp.]